MFDVSGLFENKMMLSKGWRGTYYTDHAGVCVAKVCRTCRVALPVSDFTPTNDNSSGYIANCKPCTYKKNKHKSNLYRKTIREKYSNRTKEQIELDMIRLNPSGSKRCFKCTLTKPLSDFFRAKMNSDGLYQTCKVCSMESTMTRKRNKFIPYWESKGIPLVCYVCGDPWKDADHVIAEKCGGPDAPHNRLPICGPCNSSKYMHPLEDWIRGKYPDIADEVLHRVTVVYGITI